MTFEESALRIYAPLGSGGANEEGLSILCTAGDFDGLITGDMNDTVEKRLIKYGSLPDLQRCWWRGTTAPNSHLGGAAAGYNAGAGGDLRGLQHLRAPRARDPERLAAADCTIYRTDWSGTVTITAK